MSQNQSFTFPFNPDFIMLLIVKSFDILPKHSGYGSISESFALNWWILMPLVYKKLLTALYCRLSKSFSLDFLILTEYLACAVIVVLSNPSVGILPRSKKSFLLSVCTDKLLATPFTIQWKLWACTKSNNTWKSLKDSLPIQKIQFRNFIKTTNLRRFMWKTSNIWLLSYLKE